MEIRLAIEIDFAPDPSKMIMHHTTVAEAVCERGSTSHGSSSSERTALLVFCFSLAVPMDDSNSKRLAILT
jgi:hypothetical protein